MNRDDVKTHLLAILNGRQIKLDPECTEWYRHFYMGIWHIFRKTVEIRPDLYELAKKSKEDKGSTYNIKETAVNYLMCGLENQALMAAFDYPIEQNMEVGSLVFDGLMIYKDDVIPTRLEEILVGLGERVKVVI